MGSKQSFTLQVTVAGTIVNVPKKLNVPFVGTGDPIQVQWNGTNCTINSITFNPPLTGVTLPTAPDWILSYTAPTTTQCFVYTICATSNAKGSTPQCMDPEIDNTNAW